MMAFKEGYLKRILEGVETDPEFPTPRKRNHDLLATLNEGKDCVKKVKASADDVDDLNNVKNVNPTGVQAEHEHEENVENKSADKNGVKNSSEIKNNLEKLEPKLEKGKLSVKEEDGVKKEILPSQADVKKEPVEDEQGSEVLNPVVKVELMASADGYQIKTESLVKEDKLESNEIKVKIEQVEIKDYIEEKVFDDRKLFVVGLPQIAKKSDIQNYFEKFGRIEKVILKKDPLGRSRGFAFVTFKTDDGFEKAFVAKAQRFLGENITIKKAESKQGKIYVGKIPEEISSEEIKSHFSSFGTIALIEQPVDKKSEKRKNFCFITFKNEASAKLLINSGFTSINGIQIAVKKATPNHNKDGIGIKLSGPGPMFSSRPSFDPRQFHWPPRPLFEGRNNFGPGPWASY